ncbi:porin [Fontisubflavum oceani]|uniref:porin n=1 Tax=Fontisubflavum oceani TaxID=2978973 RepID=UPI0025B2A79D|nr:porin [Fontisubflavum oceani]WJY22353.1 porin [Fontisubflavum oceani]
MKKVLLATTALVLSTGLAAAQGVTLSGSAEMGIVGGDRDADGDPVNGALPSTDEVQFFQDLDVTFTMSGTTDNGLTFGASIDLDEGGDGSAASDNNYDDGGATVFLSGNFGTITMGDTDGALDWALTEAGNVGNPGSIDDAETSHAGYLGSYGDGAGDGQILRYDNTFGDFGIAISVEQDDTGLGDGVVGPASNDAGYAVGFRYNAELGGVDLALGLGYQTADFAGVEQNIIGVSVAATFAGGFEAGIQYSDWENRDEIGGVDDTHIGIGVGYSFDAFSIHANYGEFDSGAEGFGLAAAYDLGGGAGIHLGYGSSDEDGFSTDFWSLGVAMSF